MGTTGRVICVGGAVDTLVATGNLPCWTHFGGLKEFELYPLSIPILDISLAGVTVDLLMPRGPPPDVNAVTVVVVTDQLGKGTTVKATCKGGRDG